MWKIRSFTKQVGKDYINLESCNCKLLFILVIGFEHKLSTIKIMSAVEDLGHIMGVIPQ